LQQSPSDHQSDDSMVMEQVHICTNVLSMVPLFILYSYV
jgi:hypothetical protein